MKSHQVDYELVTHFFGYRTTAIVSQQPHLLLDEVRGRASSTGLLIPT
jgi:hypothetical protein